MQKSNGFSYMEVLMATILFFTIIILLLPLSSLLMKEQLVLQERRTIAYKLHDKLQSNLWNDLQHEQSTFLLENSQTEVMFDFETDQRILTGCAQWVNINHRQEEYCLHGKSPK